MRFFKNARLTVIFRPGCKKQNSTVIFNSVIWLCVVYLWALFSSCWLTLPFWILLPSELPGPPSHVSILVTSESSLFVVIKELEGDTIGLVTRYRGRRWQRWLEYIINQKGGEVDKRRNAWIESDVVNRVSLETGSRHLGWQEEAQLKYSHCVLTKWKYCYSGKCKSRT